MRYLAKWMCLASGVGLVAALPLLPDLPRAFAQDQGVAWYQQNTQVVLANARRKIEPVLSADHRAIARSIEYRVTSSGGLNAFAATENGHRVIVIHGGLVQVLDWFNDAIVMETRLNKASCFKEYAAYLAARVQENTERVANRLPPKAVAPPVRYASMTHGDCSGVTPRDFAALTDYGEDRAKAIEASIMFMYLHELGHHVLGHTDDARPAAPASLAMTREKEDAADQFAVLTALKAQYFLTVATPWHAFVAAFGGNSIEAEEKSDHPLGLRRVLSVFDRTITFLRANPQAWPSPSNYREMLNGLVEERARLEDQVEDID